ncbi:MAG: dienelactone hydrolase family protein [Chloroflexota bacterium]|nr:dienelactone hydrolase family protein [Chloroflexota bacterium]
MGADSAGAGDMAPAPLDSGRDGAADDRAADGDGTAGRELSGDMQSEVDSATPDSDEPDHSRGPPTIIHRDTFSMEVGTHRPEIFATGGDILVLVVHPQPDGSLHRGYRYSADLELLTEPFMVSERTERYGGPADHRALIVDDQLIVTYQSNVRDESAESCAGGPAEACTESQSLLFARFELDGTERFRGPIIADVMADMFHVDSFPDHSLLWQGDHLLVSTGSVGNPIVSLRTVDIEDARVIETYRYPTDRNEIPSSIGNSLYADENGLWLLSHNPMEGTIHVSLLGEDYLPGESIVITSPGLAQTFPTGVLDLGGGYVAVAYIAKSDEGGANPRELDYYPYLRIFDSAWKVVWEEAVGDGAPGSGHLHPTLARIGDTLYYAWSSRQEREDGSGGFQPQVRIERYDLDEVPSGDSTEVEAGQATDLISETDLVIDSTVDGVTDGWSDRSTDPHPDGSFTCRPAGRGPFPAVLYSHGGRHGAVGGDLKGTCEALAEAGYLAHAERRPDNDNWAIQLDDALSGLDELLEHPDTDTARVGVMGFSRGGLLTLQMAIARPGDIQATILMAPAHGMTRMEETLTDVSDIDAPVLLLVSENDTLQADHASIIEDVEAALLAAEKAVELIVYPPYGNDGHTLFFEVRDPYWPDVLDFFDKRL